MAKSCFCFMVVSSLAGDTTILPRRRVRIQHSHAETTPVFYPCAQRADYLDGSCVSGARSPSFWGRPDCKATHSFLLKRNAKKVLLTIERQQDLFAQHICLERKWFTILSYNLKQARSSATRYSGQEKIVYFLPFTGKFCILYSERCSGSACKNALYRTS